MALALLDTTGSFNTGVGGGALALNNADSNTAVGAAALLLNTTGTENTAVGTDALVFNDIGGFNTANGAFALFSNTMGHSNTAIGRRALFSNIDGGSNVAVGLDALFSNLGATGNTAIGHSALTNNTGVGNTALGNNAGANQTTGGNNVYIGNQMSGVAGEDNACYIRSIFGQTSASGIPVFINSNNKLGTGTSSKRFKDDIKPMDKVSEALFSLRPVSFRYKKEIDPAGISQLGLVAEDVEKVNRDLIVRDKEGKPYSVRYDQVNAMLLNEFLKEHSKVEKLEATVTEQQKSFQSKLMKQEKQIEALASGLYKVSAQIETSKPAAQVIVNNP